MPCIYGIDFADVHPPNLGLEYALMSEFSKTCEYATNLNGTQPREVLKLSCLHFHGLPRSNAEVRSTGIHGVDSASFLSSFHRYSLDGARRSILFASAHLCYVRDLAVIAGEFV